MKNLAGILMIVFLISSCQEKKDDKSQDNYVRIATDTLNKVKMGDTLLINESTCRGCAYEMSTHFDMADSLNLVKLVSIKTIDNNPPDMAGGNVMKQLFLVPQAKGETIIKVYKFWKEDPSPEDSTHPALYKIQIN